MHICVLEKRHCVAAVGCFVLVCLAGSPESGAVGRKGPELRHHSSSFSLWGLDISAAALSDESTAQAIAALNVYAQYGINGVTLSFQPQDSGRGAFAADGSVANQALCARIHSLSRAAIDRWMVPVIRIFSPNQRARLESSAAYERALREVAQMFRRNIDAILNIGYVNEVKDLPKYVRILREGGYRGLVGADVYETASAPVDVMFLGAELRDPAHAVKADKPVVLTAVVENPKQRGKPHPGIREFVQTVAQKRGLFLIAQIPSCCEGTTPNFGIGGENAQSDIGVAWYLRTVSEVQLALHGPIEKFEAASSSEVPLLDPGEKEEGFDPLFDGQTLRGWTILSDTWQSFSVRDGVIACDATSPNSYLRTARRYSDFILRLDARIEPGGNSGIFIRAPLWGRSSRIGFELQIEGKPSPNPTRDSAGAIYDVLPPKVDAMRPAGEWNAYEIMCHGTHVRIKINNRVVQDFNMDEIPKMRDRLREGVIGLQDHSDKVWFRKIRIKELE